MKRNMVHVKRERHRFVEDLGQQMVDWGLPRTTGRTYAFLLLQPRPVSLDEIARGLDVAKSGASVSARQLVGFGLARAVGERGSRRVRYEALYDPQAMLASRNGQVLSFLARLREGARVAPSGSPRQHLTEMASFLEELLREIGTAIQRVKESRLR